MRALFQSVSNKQKKRKAVLWVVCDEWLLWARIHAALVYSVNIMYHKFHLHFFSSKITFYPIHRCFLCWLKGTLKQTAMQALLHHAFSLTLHLSPFSELFLIWLVIRIFSIISHRHKKHPTSTKALFQIELVYINVYHWWIFYNYYKKIWDGKPK